MGFNYLCREQDGSIELLRCYGVGGRIEIPPTIANKKVTALGSYIFSANMREEPEGFLWTEEAFDSGQGPEVGPNGRQPFCGNAVEEVLLPPAIKQIGKYAFYNCDKLKKLHFTAAVSDIGAGAFNGCRNITDLYVRVVKGEKSCLKEVLTELNETLTVHYGLAGPDREEQFETADRARLLFPVFYEEAVENTPARMLETHTHGCGHRYRYCFQGTDFQFREYDSLLPHAMALESPAHVVELAAGRLRYPMELTQEAEYAYREYILRHIDEAALYLVERDDMAEWKWFIDSFAACEWTEFEHASANCLGNEGMAKRAHEELFNIKKPVLGETGLDKLIEVSNRFGRIEALSLLMDAKYRAFPIKNNQFEL